jgi:hypothetical protein
MLYAIINFPFLIAIDTLLELVPFRQTSQVPLFSAPVRHSIITVVGMIVLVTINLKIQQQVVIFGLCGGWGVTFIVYAIPSAIALGAGSHADPPWAGPTGVMVHRALLVLSLFCVVVIAVAFSYTLFDP